MVYVIFLFFIPLALYLIFWQGCLLLAIVLHAPTVYTNQKAVDDALSLAQLKAGEIVIDLGCGNANTLILAAKKFGAKGIGVEISPYCYLASNLNILRAKEQKNVRVFLGDFKKVEKQLRQADVVYLYLLDTGLKKIEKWFFDLLKPGARVVSMSFKFAINQPVKIIQTENLGRVTKIRLYIKK